ncbi:MAG TPA: DUF58 domain-containing protein [Candidatus Sumerlaeota bacterium]|nr:DUF58 domain-containing protein [Candidatus Sumerlaeota bacterium]
MPDLDLATLQQKVRRIEIVSNRLVSERVAGEYHSVFKGQGIEFEEVRPYTYGDEIRSIDWNVTARAGEPHIKRYREEREMTVFFVVDLSGSCRFGTRVEFKSELMAEVCAVLSLAAIANNDQVGLLLCTDRLEKVVPPRKGRRHVLRLIREVLAFEPQGDGTDLTRALDHLRHVLHRRAVVFVISDFLTRGFEQSLAVVRQRHDVIAIAVEDPIEHELPDAGLIELIDSETGRLTIVDSGSRRVREDYRRQVEQRRLARRRLCRKLEVDLVELRTDASYELELIKFFRLRVRRLRHRV